MMNVKWKSLEILLVGFCILELLASGTALRKTTTNSSDTDQPRLPLLPPDGGKFSLRPIPINVSQKSPALPGKRQDGGILLPVEPIRNPLDKDKQDPFDPVAAEFSSNGTVYTPPGSKEMIRMCPNNVCGSSCNSHNAFGFAQCFCDSYCEIFNDCCYNHEKCSKSKTLAIKLAPMLKSKERYFSCSYKVDNVLVSRCPEGSDDYFAHACQSGIDTTIYRATPVTVAGIPYKNVYCAQCFGKTLSMTLFWNSKNKRHVINIRNEIALFLNSAFPSIFKNFSPPRVEQFLRSCDPNVQYKSTAHQYPGVFDVISTCAEPLSSSIKDFANLKRKCELYNAEVFTLQGPGELPLRFKNVNCLRCNGISDEWVACPHIFSPVERRLGLVELIDVEKEQIGYTAGARPPRPDFTDLFNLDQEGHVKNTKIKCPEETIYDALSKECRTPRRCDITRTEWRGECIRNPFDQAYANPKNGGSAVFTVDMDYTFKEPLVLIFRDKDTLGTDWSHVMANAVATTVRVSEDKIIDLKATLRPVDMKKRKFLGGEELTYGIGTKVVTSFYYERKDTEDIDHVALRINETAQSSLWSTITFNVTNFNVTRPLQCSEGEIVIIQENMALIDFLTSWIFPNETDQVRRLETINEKNELYYSVCDIYAEKFKGCSILNYSRESFEESADSNVLIFRETKEKISKAEYAIIGDGVFVCSRAALVYVHTDSVNVILTIVGLTLSMIFLTYILITYTIFPKLRTLPGTMLMNLCAILLLAQLLFVTSTLPGHITAFCYTFSVIHHYAWISTFFWMNAIAINLVRTFTAAMKSLSRSSAKKSLMKFSLYAYGLPALLVMTCVVLDLTGGAAIGYGSGGRSGASCWISERDGLLYAFFIPVAAVITTNTGLFIATAIAIVRTKKITKKATERGASKTDFLLYAKISTVIGFTWILGFVGALTNATAIWYCFIIFNTLSGVFLALGFAFNKRVLKLWRSKVTEVSVTTSGTRGSSVNGRGTTLTSTSGSLKGGQYVRAKTTDSDV